MKKTKDLSTELEHIILDIDETLLYAEGSFDTKIKITPRPYLKKFLTFLFENFKTVNIWTAGSEGYMNFVIKYLKENGYTPEGKSYFQKHHFTSCAPKKCKGVMNGDYYYIKPLSKIWRKKKRLGISKYNSLIIDDTPETYEKNFGNAIRIPKFKKENKKDDCLLMLCNYLLKLKKVGVRGHGPNDLFFSSKM